MPLNVVVGVSGGIAAYKAAYLVSSLVKQGHSVSVLMTKNAHNFVGRATFETLSANAVLTDTFEKSGKGVSHIAIAKQADVFVVAPATANLIARAAHGIADDMLTTALLAVTCPVIFAPAMNAAMYNNAATQHNLNLLSSRGYHVMETGAGALACGDTGTGRMKEPDEIVEFINGIVAASKDMLNVRVLVSAGPTHEMIDPVRYLSNRSSGKMGYSIAREAAMRGADVTLVSGPVSLEHPKGVRLINVVSAAQMCEQVLGAAQSADIIIMTAAVTDYMPKTYSEFKIKKDDKIAFEFVRTDDILSILGRRKKSGQLLAGFAAETNDFERNARKKLFEKAVDIIALNDVSREGEGFGSDYNNIKLFISDGQVTDLGSDTKKNLARKVIDILFKHYIGIKPG